MIHHVSIPARDPQHVATVLAELLGGYAGPFVGPIPGAWVVYQEDGCGTGIEVYEDRTALVPDDGTTTFTARLSDQFDAVLHFDVTRAVEPLERTAGWEAGEPPETYPVGF